MRAITWRSTIRMCGAIVLLWTQAGCLTQQAWQNATRSNAIGPIYVFKSPDPAGPRLRAMYFVAGLNSAGNVYDLGPAPATQPSTWPTVPIDEHGRAVRAAIDDYVPLTPGRLVETIKSDQSYPGRRDEAFAELVTFVPAAERDPRRFVVFAVGSPTHTVGGGESTDGRAKATTRPAYLVGVPSAWPRPPGPRGKQIVATALMTPLLLVADVVFTPLLLIAGTAYDKGP